MTPAWLDAMPAIPLARGVPTVTRLGEQADHHGVVVRMFDGGATAPEARIVGDNERTATASGSTRVDLDDPQGFAYALRWLWRALDGMPWSDRRRRIHVLFRAAGPTPSEAGIWLRHLTGTTTGADRITLAKACAEVAQ